MGEVGWRDDWATTDYARFLDPVERQNRLRVQLRYEPGRGVVRFSVQYEARFGVGERFRAVVRWDSAHGRAHRDTLDPAGNAARKDWIDGVPYAQVVTNAIAAVKRDWKTYRAAFERMTQR